VGESLAYLPPAGRGPLNSKKIKGKREGDMNILSLTLSIIVEKDEDQPPLLPPFRREEEEGEGRVSGQNLIGQRGRAFISFSSREGKIL